MAFQFNYSVQQIVIKRTVTTTTVHHNNIQNNNFPQLNNESLNAITYNKNNKELNESYVKNNNLKTKKNKKQYNNKYNSNNNNNNITNNKKNRKIKENNNNKKYYSEIYYDTKNSKNVSIINKDLNNNKIYIYKNLFNQNEDLIKELFRYYVSKSNNFSNELQVWNSLKPIVNLFSKGQDLNYIKSTFKNVVNHG